MFYFFITSGEWFVRMVKRMYFCSSNTMNEKVKNIGSKLINSDQLVFTFIRSASVAQAASWADLGTGFLLFAFAHFSPWISTAIGAFVGGVINGVLNYKFTFHAQECPWKAVMVKYAMVWVGSLLLNSFGTQCLYYGLMHWEWLETLGFKRDGYFAAARLAVSGIVSLGWNFLLQRGFVYRKSKFDPYAISFVDSFIKKNKKKLQSL